MRLLQFSYSPFAAKVRVCLNLKGIRFEVVNVKYTERSELVKLTGGVTTPVLIDEGQVILDSPQIVAYLDRQRAPALRDVPLAPVFEQWADEVFQEAAFRLACPGLEDHMGLEQGEEARLMFRLIKERRYGSGAVAQWRGETEAHLSRVKQLLVPIARSLERRPFLLGEQPSVADAALWGQLFMVEVAHPDFVRVHAPALADWYGRLRA